jgi:hypothetical protein
MAAAVSQALEEGDEVALSGMPYAFSRAARVDTSAVGELAPSTGRMGAADSGGGSCRRAALERGAARAACASMRLGGAPIAWSLSRDRPGAPPRASTDLTPPASANCRAAPVGSRRASSAWPARAKARDSSSSASPTRLERAGSSESARSRAVGRGCGEDGIAVHARRIERSRHRSKGSRAHPIVSARAGHDTLQTAPAGPRSREVKPLERVAVSLPSRRSARRSLSR